MRIMKVFDGGRKMAYEPKKKKPWQIEEERESDPMVVLGVDLMLKVFGNLDARSLTLSLLVSRSWFSPASSDTLWSPLCQHLWVGKAHIPRRSKLPGLSKLASYSHAVIDSKRVHITREDLWDHAWNFHFTEATSRCSKFSFEISGLFWLERLLLKCYQAAPAYWKNLDPYWRGEGPLMRRYFHPDGTVTSDPEDEVWGGHECSYTVVTSVLLSNGKIKDNYVRVNRWPRLIVSRREDWGWEMLNVIFAYSSILDAEKEGGTGPPS